jgi:hypothetical protein
MSHTRGFKWRAQFMADKKDKTGDEQSQEHAHHFL